MAEDTGHLLAIDVGTTTTRCVLFDLRGRQVGGAYREPPVRYPRPGWAEVAPGDWWTATVAVVREALEATRVPREQVLGVGLCGLKHAVVPVDAGGTPLANAMLWMDQRCRPQAEWMTREYGELIGQVLGRGPEMTTTPSAPKLRWIVENEPELLRRTTTFLLPKDFIRLRLTGTIATDPSDAGGTGLYDRRSGGWSRPLLALAGVPPGKMPPIHGSASLAGSITQEAARLTGLAPGTPVVVGGGDVGCTLIGANARAPVAPGAPIRACLYLGTAAWVSTQRTLSAGTFGATATTGAALKWLSALYRPESEAGPGDPSPSYADLVELAQDAPLGSNGLLFLPHLMGERAPRPDPCAVGVLYGLTLAHGRGEIARAILEGCACQLRRIVEALGVQVDELVAVGGCVKSRLWLQIIADVTGLPLLVPRVVEAGALGAAILAAVGIGLYPSVELAAEEWVQIAGRVEPNATAQAAYGEVYTAFLELEEHVAPMYAREETR
jgi:xylulokinase